MSQLIRHVVSIANEETRLLGNGLSVNCSPRLMIARIVAMAVLWMLWQQTV